MRLTDRQIDAIRRVTRELASNRARVRVFGSRLDDAARVVRKQSCHLLATDGRLFESGFGPTEIARLEIDAELAERTEAFVSRFGPLQDTLADW